MNMMNYWMLKYYPFQKSNLKFKPINSKLKDYDYDGWFTEEELDDKTLECDEEELDNTQLLQGDKEEVKQGNGIKILTLNKVLTRLPVLLAQIKAGNNSYKLKIEIRQILYHLYQHNKNTKKTLQQFNQVIILMEVHILDNKLVITLEWKTFRFD